jgi:alkylation response protein AidB-like acyl-CoA dehydrogenase
MSITDEARPEAATNGSGAVDDAALQVELRRLVERAKVIRADIALHADEVDRAGRDTTYAMQRCVEEGVIRLSIPREHGGLSNGDMRFAAETWIAMNTDISAGDGSAGRNFATQLGTTRLVFAAASHLPETLGQLAGELLRGEVRLMASNAENRADGPVTARAVDGGVLVTGVKSFNTNSGQGGIAMVGLSLEGRPGRYHALVRLDSPNVVQHHDWDMMGQRGTYSQTITFDDVFVPDGWHFPPAAPNPVQFPMFSLIQSAMNLGIGLGAFDAALRYVREMERPSFPEFESAQKDPLIRRRIGDFGARLNTAYLAMRQAARHAEEVDLADQDAVNQVAVDAACVKVASMTAAVDAANGIFELMGAHSAARKYGFDRYWRDVRTDSLHDPLDQQRMWVGDWHLNGTPPRTLAQTHGAVPRI